MSIIIRQLVCKNYGYDCDFETKGDLPEKIIKDFRVHTWEAHHIDYPEGVLMSFILRRKYFQNSLPFYKSYEIFKRK